VWRRQQAGAACPRCWGEQGSKRSTVRHLLWPVEAECPVDPVGEAIGILHLGSARVAACGAAPVSGVLRRASSVLRRAMRTPRPRHERRAAPHDLQQPCRRRAP